MTYEEIEEALARVGKKSMISQLRQCVGKEAVALERSSPPLDSEQAVAAAKGYFAKDVSDWLKGDGELKPDDILNHRSRYAESWAIASILREDDEPLENEDEEVVELGAFDQALLKICNANADIGLRLVEVSERIKQVRDLELQVENMASTLRDISSAMDQAGVPVYSELKRTLSIHERLEILILASREGDED